MIPNSIVRNYGISNVSKMIFTSLAMSRNVNQTRLFQQTSIKGLLALTGYKNRSENQIMMKKGLLELIKLNVISIYSDLAMSEDISPSDLNGSMMFFVKFNDEYVYSDCFVDRFEKEEIDKELIEYGLRYTTIYVEDAVKLLTFKSKQCRANILSFYLMAISRALIGDRGDKYSTETIDSIIKYVNINEKTAQKYITTLFNAKLLFKLTMREIKRKTGEIRDHNIYLRWSDKDNIIVELERDDWFMKMTLLKISNIELTAEQCEMVKKRSRELNPH
jgi:hypothetical protein